MTTRKMVWSLIIAAGVMTQNLCANQSISIIPKPLQAECRAGSFELDEKVVIVNVDPNNDVLIDYVSAAIRQQTGLSLKTKGKPPLFGRTIIFTSTGADLDLGDEGYTLSVGPKKIVIAAPTSAGLFYGVQSLLQLIPLGDADPYEIPCVKIKDWPRFPWRGIMLDASRHFQSVEYVKRYLDLMAMHKLNVFHWHLVDDHGWRIEIKKYPELTDVGAWRNQPGYSEEYGPYGGFYTQDQIRNIVQYAAEREITVIPEIEMPGHSYAAIAAYPRLSCTEEKHGVDYFYTYPAKQQRFPPRKGSGVFCAGKEETFKFLEDVLQEVMELFPSEYIHVGGDEANKSWWKKCQRCQGRIKAEGLKDENELQSYFIKRIETYLNSKDRRLIGWDEILEGGLAPNATVMSWRGIRGGVKAAIMGHDVVMTPQEPLYFDHGQSSDPLHPAHWPGIETIEEVYAYDPVPSDLTSDQAIRVLGAQANMWTVYTHTGELIDLQMYPRACALSEITWSPKSARNWDDFKERLELHTKRLDMLGVNYYRGSSVEVGKWSPENITEEKTALTFDISDLLKESGKYAVGIDYSQGKHGLDIFEVSLLGDGVVISKDTHKGFTGASNKENRYWIELPEKKPNMLYQLQVTAASSGGTGSYGQMTMSLLNKTSNEQRQSNFFRDISSKRAIIELSKIPDQERARQIKDLKWGMFICWSFSTFSGREWTHGVQSVDFFKAATVDTDQWARIAKEAGMGYILFLVKHHDGFCLWDTKTTDWKVTKAPLGRDVLAELRKSCDRYGIKLALYFSEGDWTWKGKSNEQQREIQKAQIKELSTEYGPIEFWWIDHAQGTGGIGHREKTKWIHSFQPNTFVGYNHGEPSGRLCLRERGRPGRLGDAAASKYNKEGEKNFQDYLVAEFTYPILPEHQGGADWFYSLPKHDELCHSVEKIYKDYIDAVQYENIFSINIGPDYDGRIRDIDAKTLRHVGKMIRATAN